MNREQQGVILFLTLALCLLYFMTSPGGLREGISIFAPAKSERPWIPTGGKEFVLELDGQVERRGIIPAGPGMTVGEALDQAGRVYGRLSLPEEVLGQKIEKSGRLSVLPGAEGQGKVIWEPLSPAKGKILSLPVAINSATAEELDALPGIGPRMARAIVEFREKYGNFSTPEDLLRVPGIGARKLAALKPRITVP
jgi:competence protein ComEA